MIKLEMGNKTYIGKYKIGDKFIKQYENGNEDLFVILGASINLRENSLALDIYNGEECEIEYHLYKVVCDKRRWMITCNEKYINEKLEAMEQSIEMFNLIKKLTKKTNWIVYEYDKYGALFLIPWEECGGTWNTIDEVRKEREYIDEEGRVIWEYSNDDIIDMTNNI